jgi:2-dehydropantoate 2-reductase
MRIAVMGAGAIGGYFGAKLALSGQEVHFIARGKHLDELQRSGLRVESVDGDFAVAPGPGGVLATADPAAVGPVDIVMFCVKSYDTEVAAEQLAPMIGPSTGVISLQNGIDNEEKLVARLGPDHVMGGVAFIFAERSGPGMIRHTGGARRIVFGELDGTSSTRASAFLEACQRAGFPAEISPDIRAALWSKFAFICAQAGLTAAVRLSIGEIRDAPESWALFRRVVDEALAAARAEGIDLPADQADRLVAMAAGLEADGRSSLHDDLVAGRRMELDALLGELVRRGRLHAIDVSASEALVAILRPWQKRNEPPVIDP